MRFTRASPLSLARPLTLVSRFCTSRVSSKSLIGFSSGVGVNFSTEVSTGHRQSHAGDVRSLVGSQEQNSRRLLLGRASKAGGWITMTGLDPQPEPPNLSVLKAELGSTWPMTLSGSMHSVGNEEWKTCCPRATADNRDRPRRGYAASRCAREEARQCGASGDPQYGRSQRLDKLRGRARSTSPSR